MNHQKNFLPVLTGFFLLNAFGTHGYPGSLNEKKTLLYAEFMQEVNTFNPLISTERDFRAGYLVFGDEVALSAREDETQLAGFLKAVDDLGGGMVETIPVLRATAMSGGPVDSVFYKMIREAILEGVRSHPEACGIYLSMHGAMGVQGMFDPEGDILAAIREITGPDFTIAVSFDLHANNTVKRAESADIIVGYHTNPHRDHFDTGYRTTAVSYTHLTLPTKRIV